MKSTVIFAILFGLCLVLTGCPENAGGDKPLKDTFENIEIEYRDKDEYRKMSFNSALIKDINLKTVDLNNLDGINLTIIIYNTNLFFIMLIL